MECREDIGSLTDVALLTRAQRLSETERQVVADLIEHLIEIDRRKLYAQSSSSLFTYLTGVLRYSESAAGRRAAVTRLCAKVPRVLGALRTGRLQLCGASLLASVITPENVEEILKEASGRSTRQLEELLVRFAPRPVARDGIRKLALVEDAPGASESRSSGHNPPRNEDHPPSGGRIPAAKKDELKPATPELYNIRFAAKRAFVDKLERVQELLSHSTPMGSYEEVLEKVLDAYLAKHDPLEKSAAASPSDTGGKEKGASRYIPRGVKAEVVRRDGAQCSHVDPATATRCTERRFLHFDHRVPFSRGGRSNDAANIRLLCAAHNQHAARQEFGADWIARKIAGRNQTERESITPNAGSAS